MTIDEARDMGRQWAEREADACDDLAQSAAGRERDLVAGLDEARVYDATTGEEILDYSTLIVVLAEREADAGDRQAHATVRVEDEARFRSAWRALTDQERERLFTHAVAGTVVL